MIAFARFTTRNCCVLRAGIVMLGATAAWAGNMACEPIFNGIVDAILLPNTSVVCSVGNLCSDTNHTFTWSASSNGGQTYTADTSQTGATAIMTVPACVPCRLLIKCDIGGHKTKALGPKEVFVVEVSPYDYPHQDMINQIREGHWDMFKLQVLPTTTAFTSCSQTLEPINGGNPFAILTGSSTSITTNWIIPCRRRSEGMSINFIEASTILGETARWFAQVPGDNRLLGDGATNGNAAMCTYTHKYSLTVGSTVLNGGLNGMLRVDVVGHADAEHENVSGAVELDMISNEWYIVGMGTLERFEPMAPNDINMSEVEADSVFRDKVYGHECEHIRQARDSIYFTDVAGFYLTNLEGQHHRCIEGLRLYIKADTARYRCDVLSNIYAFSSVFDRERGAIHEENTIAPDYLELNENQITNYAIIEYNTKQATLSKAESEAYTFRTNYMAHTCNP